MTEKGQEPTATLDAEQVATYLSQHPEFFVGHDEPIPESRISHRPGDTASLVECQVRLLCRHNIEMRHRFSQLMDVAHENNRLFDKTCRLVLGLLDATSLEDVVSTVEGSLRHEFQVPYMSLIPFSSDNVPMGHSVNSAEAYRAIGSLLSGGKTVCGVLCPHKLTFLSGESDRDEAGSAAMVSLSSQGLHGVLAIGGPDPQRYKGSLDALFLGYVARVPARVLSRFSSPLHSVR